MRTDLAVDKHQRPKSKNNHHPDATINSSCHQRAMLKQNHHMNGVGGGGNHHLHPHYTTNGLLSHQHAPYNNNNSSIQPQPHVMDTDDSSVKNSRSSSLPLKIMINGGVQKNATSISCSFSPTASAASPLSAFLAHHQNSASLPFMPANGGKMSRSGNGGGGSPVAPRKGNVKMNDFRGFFINRYVQLSQSERFLNMLVLKETEQQHQHQHHLKPSTSTSALFSNGVEASDMVKNLLLPDQSLLARKLAALKLRKDAAAAECSATRQNSATTTSDRVVESTESAKALSSSSQSKADVTAADDDEIASIASSIVEFVKNEAIKRAEREQQQYFSASPPLSPSPSSSSSSSLSTSPAEAESCSNLVPAYQQLEVHADTCSEPVVANDESCLESRQSEIESCSSSSETVSSSSSSSNDDENNKPETSSNEPETDETTVKVESVTSEQQPNSNGNENDENTTWTTATSAETATNQAATNDETTSPESDDNCDCESLNGSTSSMDSEILAAFRPKKSCLAKKSKLFGDDAAESSGGEQQQASESPPNSCSEKKVNWTLGVASAPKKKSVLFADNFGKELFTVKTMTEPSNCPPKLTSKIVLYLLHKEFSSSSSSLNNLTSLDRSPSYSSFMGLTKDGSTTSHLKPGRTGSPPSMSSSYLQRSHELTGSGGNSSSSGGNLASYSLNFEQPAGDYLKFRKRLEQSCVSLENVLLNRCVINGTIKVKNINYHKQVFVRCSLDGWKTHADYQAQYVPSDFYSSGSCSMISSPSSSPTFNMSSSSFYSSPSSSSSSASINNSHYMPQHKDYDTFRFEIELPKTAEQNLNFRCKTLLNDFAYSGQSPNSSIQMCVCYRTGQGAETREYWDSNDGQNYEIVQYLMLQPPSSPSSSSSLKQPASMYKSRSSRSSSASSSSRPSPPSSLYYSSSAFAENQISGIYY